MNRTLTLMLAAGMALPIAACGQQGAPSPDATTTASSETSGGGVVRTDVPAQEEAPVTPMPAQAAIQSQPGPDGAQVDLLKVAVTGDILTVTFRCSSDQKINSESFRVKDISVIDDATAQRISVLKDNEGNWLASNAQSDHIGTSCTVRPGVFWAKFPAPPATSKTVSINLPETAPFDGVPVMR